MKKNIFFIIALLFLSACSSAGKEPENPIFSGTTLITPASTTGSGSTLTFIWQSPSTVYQVVGIFSSSISVEGKKIVNTSDCVALWSSGMTGSAGKVPLTNFKVFQNGAVGANVTALPGGDYHWAVWGQDEGMIVTHSSAEIKFTY